LLERGSANPKAAQKSERKVRFQESSDVQTSPIYERDRLLAGNEVTGPAVIEQADSTTLVPPSFKALVDPHGRLIMTQNASAESRTSRSTGQKRSSHKSLAG
jgi:N-methylhydantoinase A